MKKKKNTRQIVNHILFDLWFDNTLYKDIKLDFTQDGDDVDKDYICSEDGPWCLAEIASGKIFDFQIFTDPQTDEVKAEVCEIIDKQGLLCHGDILGRDEAVVANIRICYRNDRTNGLGTPANLGFDNINEQIALRYVPSELMKGKNGLAVYIPRSGEFAIQDRDGCRTALDILYAQPYKLYVSSIMYFERYELIEVLDAHVRLKDALGNIVLHPRYMNMLMDNTKFIHSFVKDVHCISDLVQCSQCLAYMLLPLCAEKCPICSTAGCLSYPEWSDEHVEISLSELENQDYIIIKHPHLDDDLLFVDED